MILDCKDSNEVHLDHKSNQGSLHHQAHLHSDLAGLPQRSHWPLVTILRPKSLMLTLESWMIKMILSLMKLMLAGEMNWKNLIFSSFLEYHGLQQGQSVLHQQSHDQWQSHENVNPRC